MKNPIERINYHLLRNEAHVELHETVNRLFGIYTPDTLGIMPLYQIYKPLFDIEVSVLDVIRKSEYTVEIYEQDRSRDHIFRGLTDALKSALNHFDPAKADAARKVNTVFEHYGNIAAKTLDQETAAIDDLLRELASADYPALIQTLAVADWLTQLDTENNRFKTLMMERYGESALRPTTQMKQARAETDKAFRTIIAQIEALVIVNGAATYEPFIKELNVVLSRYKNILAQEAGTRKKNEK
jgi:hypothetical protein